MNITNQTSNKNIHVSKMCLEILSPTNVSDGTVLNAKEYLYDSANNTVYFLNQPAWHKFIYTHNLFEKYEAYLLNTYSNKSLFTWLTETKYTIEDVLKANAIKAKAIAKNTDIPRLGHQTKYRTTLNDICCQAKLSDGSIFIPGSTLKGIFRTVLLFQYLQQNEYIRQKYYYEIKNLLNSRGPINKLNNKLEKEFSASLFTYKSPTNNRFSEPNKNIGILCSDTNGLKNEEISTAVLQKIDMVINNRQETKANALSVFRECILGGTKFEFSLKLDTTYTSKIGINSIDDLLLATENYFKKINAVLARAFKKNHADLFQQTINANIYLGANTGFLTKTLILALTPNNDEARYIISKILSTQKQFSKHKHFTDKIISPRTLKATYYNQKYYLMGLAKVYKQDI